VHRYDLALTVVANSSRNEALRKKERNESREGKGYVYQGVSRHVGSLDMAGYTAAGASLSRMVI
jgi:hypothetical protein